MALNRSDKSRILRRYFPRMTRNSEMSTEPSSLPPELFRFLCALALIIPALFLACGSDEPPAATATSASDRATATPAPAPATATATPEASLPLAQTSPETDREALVALYNAAGGPEWYSNENWLSDAPIGEWQGVTTGHNGRVIELNLGENRLSGEIPPELGNLANLERLQLGANQLSGEIPPELGNLANLEELSLGFNELRGCIPGALQDRLAIGITDLGGLPFCP